MYLILNNNFAIIILKTLTKKNNNKYNLVHKLKL